VQQLAAGWALLPHDWPRNPCQSNRLPNAERMAAHEGGWQAEKKTHWRVVPLIMSAS